MSFIDRSFCVSSCHFRGVCYNDSGFVGCICDDPAAAVDCALIVASPSVCDGLLLPISYDNNRYHEYYREHVLVLAVVFVVVVVVVGRRSRRGLGVSPEEEAMEVREIQQTSVQLALNERHVVKI
ncbi:unnamed protein product [Heligmosomoides polygyrus]|uniref:EGF-like domain-containing protein n=1 Tax=Heligmosomoides polygyrus TaxID=6339 RepID=A0A183GGA9_HELPZ|nr:unnamed protein product [Heligmosomoides polygyrus]